MSDLIDGTPEDRIINEPMSEALSKRYLAYALSTITSRALPDVRDGLKPVQRRILYGMRVLKLDPEGGYRKCAKIVGDVMGNFHPHGDSSIYDTLVRLAQDFTVRYPLVDGQGNFGNIDGDSAAAYRYTEARMTVAAELLLDGLNENAVDFRANYAENDEEPVVLPAGFPNLLANGATGIAVGMATSIPPHNAAELIDAGIILLPQSRAVADVTMTNQDGQPVQMDALKGKWSLLFFGYTYCPDICPTTLAQLRQVKSELPKDAVDRLQVVLVSVDPNRDTPNQLKQYLGYFDKDFVGVAGSIEDTQKLANALSIPFIPADTSKPGYTVDHSGNLAIVGPDGRQRGFIRAPFNNQKLGAQLPGLVKRD
mgnify:CR=1 FL=1